jgi:hypothetical protein
MGSETSCWYPMRRKEIVPFALSRPSSLTPIFSCEPHSCREKIEKSSRATSLPFLFSCKLENLIIRMESKWPFDTSHKIEKSYPSSASVN